MKPILCLLGPTAVGKSDCALDLCREGGAEIISVDSVMIYRGMDIGTAKPTPQCRQQIPHHLIDITEPNHHYSVAEFCRDAMAAIKDIHQRDKIPILAGGTMMYFHGLLHGLAQLPDRDDRIRADIEATAAEQGWPAMHERLQAIDPISAAKIKPTDPQRIQRALEVFEISGKPMSELLKNVAHVGIEHRCQQFALLPIDRKVLHERIAQRFHHMLQQGLIDEVRALQARGDCHADLPAIRAVGYRQAWQYLQGELSYHEMIERAIIATRQLAKRQLTWLRSWQNLKALTDKKELLHEMQQIISGCSPQ